MGGLSFQTTTKSKVNYNIEKVINNIVKFTFDISNPGTISVLSQKLDYQIKITSSSIIPSQEKSNCYITNNKKIYVNNDKLNFICNLYDSIGNLITPKEAVDNLNINFKTEIINTITQEKITIKNINIYTTYIMTEYNITYSGEYKIITYYIYNENTYQFKSSLDTFTVRTIPEKINNADIYDYNEKIWIKNNEINNTIIKFNGGIDIISIKLYEDDDGKISYSDFTNGYSQLNLSLIEAYITSDHRKEDYIKCDVYLIENELKDNKTYIKIILNEKDSIISSSYYYKIVIKYNNNELNIKLKYLITENGLTYCQHDITNTYTLFSLISDSFSVILGNSIKIGTVVLKNEDDNHYHDYYLNDINKLSYTSNPDKVTISYKKNDNQRGLYDVYLYSTYAGNVTMTLTYENNVIKKGRLFITFLALEIANYITLSDNNNIIKKDETNKIYTISNKTVDEETIIYINAQDKYNNTISIEDTTKLEITTSILLNGEDITNKNIINIIYNTTTGEYNIIDNNKEYGNYTIIIKTKTGEDITINYYKEPGNININNSLIEIGNKDMIPVGSYAIVYITLIDNYGNKISFDEKKHNEIINNINVYCINETSSKNPLKYNYIGIENNIKSKFNLLMEYSGTYEVEVYNNNNQLNNYSNNINSFNVIKAEFSIDNSIITLIRDTPTKMIENMVYIINSKSDKPSITLDFYDEDFNLITNIDKNIDIKANLIDKNENIIELNEKWINDSKIIFYFDNEIDLRNYEGNFTFKIIYINLEKEYIFNFVQNGNNNEDKEYDKYHFYVSNDLIIGKGEVLIELRTENDIRSNSTIININKLTYNNLDEGIYVNKYKGSLTGQILLEIYTIKYYSYNNPFILNLYYDNNEIKTPIKIINIINEGNNSNFNLNNCDIYKYDTDKNDYVKINDKNNNDDIIENSYNDYEKLIIKIVPKDDDGKIINIKDININAETNNDNIKLNVSNENYYYIITPEDEEKYKDLDKGILIITIKDEDGNEKEIKINLGGKDPSYYGDEKVSIKDTVFHEVEFTAGGYGYLENLLFNLM